MDYEASMAEKAELAKWLGDARMDVLASEYNCVGVNAIKKTTAQKAGVASPVVDLPAAAAVGVVAAAAACSLGWRFHLRLVPQCL